MEKVVVFLSPVMSAGSNLILDPTDSYCLEKKGPLP